MISILIPTRKRVEKLKRWFDTLACVTAYLDELEIVIKVDSDDDETKAYLDTLIKDLVVVEMDYDKGFLDMTKYLNAMAAKATGEYFVFAADDIYITTPRWDTTLHGVLGMGECWYTNPHLIKHIDPQYVHRSWYDTLGFMAPEDCVYADGFIAAVGNKLGLMHDSGIRSWRNTDDFDDEKQKLIDSIPVYKIRDEDYEPLGALCLSA